MKVKIVSIMLGVILLTSFGNMVGSNQHNCCENDSKIPNSMASSGTMKYGVGSLVVDLDPQQAWDSASIEVISQVCEGLFTYNLSSPELEIIPALATDVGTWNAEATEFTVNLKTGVTFHDGTLFTADDVKWTFDRLNGLIEDGLSQIAELYSPLNGELVIAETEVISDYVVTFHLAYPYVPFVSLLCFSGSSILSSSSTPEYSLLNVASDVLVGTGPYRYLSTTSTETILEAFPNYYGGWTGQQYTRIEFIYFADSFAKNQAFLDGDLDLVDAVLPEYLDAFDLSPNHVVGPLDNGSLILYMGMNNKQINKTMRQAISWAFDYDYVIEELVIGSAARLTSPVPEGILYHNPDLEYPVHNLTNAREILINAGIAPVGAAANINNDEWWTTLATADPIASYNYSYNIGNTFRADLGDLTQENLALIGIAIEIISMDWSDYLDRLLGDFDKLQLYMIGWGADYNDPSNFINPLFSNISASNIAQVNDPYLQTMMMGALTESNPAIRQQMYYDMQAYIVEDLMPWVLLYLPQSRPVYSADVMYFPPSALGIIRFYDIEVDVIPDDDFDGISNEDEINIYGTNPNNPDTDGDDLTDYQELFVYGTDPLNEDSDYDSFWDGVEITEGSDPNDPNSYPVEVSYNGILNYGVRSLVVDLDPHQAWDSTSIDLISQVCEGLFKYDLSDPEMNIIPALAADYGSWNYDGTTYTVDLREDVTFHDGSTFNAADVVYSFNRLNYLISIGESQIAELYMLNGFPLIDSVVAIGPYQVQFNLNFPYAPFEALLCFSGSYILPENEYSIYELMDTGSDILIGTGPYMYDGTIGDHTTLLAYPDYYGGWSNEQYQIININLFYDEDAKNQALLSGDVQLTDGIDSDYLPQFEADPTLTVASPQQSTTIMYLGMNNNQINKTIRQAISWAFNYDYVIDELASGNAARLTSPVPEGIIYHNPDLDYPVYDLVVARQILIDAGIAPIGASANIYNDEWWTTLATADPIASFNYSYNIGSTFRADLGALTQNNLALIGIDVVIEAMDWSEFIMLLIEGFDNLQLYMLGWGPDYNDPSNFINPMFSNTSDSNYAHVNDPFVQEMMYQGLQETDAEARQQIYYTLQEYIVEDLMPMLWLYVPVIQTVYSSEITYYPQNPMSILRFYEIHGDMVLDSDHDGIPDEDETDIYGTDPNNSDSDEDELDDYDELFVYFTNPLDPDSDDDFYWDYIEVELETDPNDPNDYPQDSDHDGVMDYIEVELFGSDPNDVDTDDDGYTDFQEIGPMFMLIYMDIPEDFYGDPTDPYVLPSDFDSDFLTDWEELYLYDTQFLIRDTDEDGVIDGYEVHQYGTDPLLIDSDFDGLNDGLEILVYLSNPLNVDSDNDNLLDNFEIYYGTDILNPDSDFDGFVDGIEVGAGSDPMSASSTPENICDECDDSTDDTTDDSSDDTNGNGTGNGNPFDGIPGFSIPYIMGSTGCVMVYILIRKRKSLIK